jgi:hypothetical protein
MKERYKTLAAAEAAYTSHKECQSTGGPDLVRRARTFLNLATLAQALFDSKPQEAILLPTNGDPSWALLRHAERVGQEAARLLELAKCREEVEEYWKTVPPYCIADSHFTAALLKRLGSQQPDLCSFDESTTAFYIFEPDHKLIIDHYDPAIQQVTTARVIPDQRPVARTGEPWAAENLRLAAAGFPDEVCVFEESSGTLWARIDKIEQISAMLG